MMFIFAKSHRAATARSSLSPVILIVFILFGTTNGTAQTKTVDSRLEQAAALIRDRQLKEAEDQLTSILKTAPNEPRALNLLGTIRAQQGRLNDAEAFFSRALRFDSHLVSAHMNLAHVSLLKGAPERTIAELKEAIRLEPNNPEATFRLASLLLAQNHLDDCITFIEPLKNSASAALLVVLGDAYLKKHDAGNAEENYQLALTRDSDDADAVLGLAEVYQFRKDLQNAALYLARAKQSVANSPATLYRFALVAMRSGSYEEANAALTQAVKLNPNEPSYLLALGTTWLQKPDLFEAEKAFRRTLELQPDNSPAQLSLGYTLMIQKKYPEARQWLEKSLERNKSVPETFYYLGQIALAQNEEQRAIEFFIKAIDLAPAYSYAHAALGSSYLRLKNYPLAQRELELSVKLNPNDGKAHYDLAVLFARLKNNERAQEEMQIVEKLKTRSSADSKDSRPSTSPIPPE